MASSTVEQKVIMNEFHKMTKQYRKAFENVLQGHYDDAVPILKEYLSYLDNNVKRPIRHAVERSPKNVNALWKVKF